jgi:phosphoserine phosphatase RsbU/P
MNGNEIALEGALPLGIAAGIDFAATSFLLEPGAQLTFISDGVVEAKNSHQELFGFDRAREISTQQAVRIADAARRFGQEDDITVLTVGRISASAHN